MMARRLSFRTRTRSDLGFSALEALVVVAILLTIAALVYPNFTTWREESNLNGIARQIQADLQWSRMEAVQRSCPVTVSFVSGQAGYTIWEDRDRDGSQDSGEVINRSTAQQFRGIQVGNTVQLVFQPRGNVSSTGIVTLSNSQGSKTLSVNVAGRVSIS